MSPKWSCDVIENSIVRVDQAGKQYEPDLRHLFSHRSSLFAVLVSPAIAVVSKCEVEVKDGE